MRIKKYYKLIRVDYEDSAYFRIKNTSNTDGVFTITRVGSPTTAYLKYSLDGVNWTTANLSADFSLAVGAGANVYMKGTNARGFNRNTSSYYKIAMNVNHTIGGNIMSIVDETNYATVTSIPSYCFAHLFNGDTYLVNAGVNFGSVTSIGNNGCVYMYRNCTSLTTPSDFSSVTSIDSDGCSLMYGGCTSLTTGGDLSSITSVQRGGLAGFYLGCTSLTKVTTPNVSSWDTYAFNNWLENTAATGVVRKPAGLDIPTNTNGGVPSGWTTEDY